MHFSCLFGYTTRREAERILMGQKTPIKGSYLIRCSESQENAQALSVLDYDENGDFYVLHYCITRKQNSFIINNQTYSTLSNVVNTYKSRSHFMRIEIFISSLRNFKLQRIK